MAKKTSVRTKRAKKIVTPTTDAKLDFADIPELTDFKLRKMKKAGRPKIAFPKQLIAIRIAPSLLNNIRKLAYKRDRPYQTLIHELLEEAIKNIV